MNQIESKFRQRCRDWCLICTLLVAGCAATPEHFYTLTGDDTADSAAPAGDRRAGQAVIAIDAISLPEQVDRPEIVTVDPQHRVVISEQQRWASSLQAQVSELLASGLARRLNALVTAYPEPELPGTGLRISLDIQRFDAEPGREVVIEALWSARSAEGNKLLSERLSARSPLAGGDYTAVVAAYRTALLQMTQRMAEGIRSLPDQATSG